MICPHGNNGKCELCDQIRKEEDDRKIKELREKTAAIQLQSKQTDIEKRIKSSLISPKFQGCSFDNYQADTPAQKIAVQKCRDFVDGFKTDNHDLVLIGGPGTGKDHLTASICRELMAGDYTCLVTDAEKIQRMVRDGYKNKELTEQAIFDKLIAVDLLAINELGTRTSEAQAVVLNELCNDRQNNLKRTIYIGNLTIGNFREIMGDRAFDRIVRKDKSNVIIFDWNSFRR